jgi:fermentation-respiration switch protein FrsA (DUF1100 family)
MIRCLVVIFMSVVIAAMVSVVCIDWILGWPVQRAVGNPPVYLEARSVHLESPSGTSIAGWWCPVPCSRGAVLLLPGVRANRLSMIDRAGFLRRAHYSVLLIDFQATGESKGDRITFGWKESRDVLAAVDFIRSAEPSSHIAIIGSSLGGAAALLATPPLRIDALILEAVYPTIEIATRNRQQNYLGTFGQSLSPLLTTQLQPWLGISANDLRPIDHIAAVGCPVLMMSGEKDRHTRPEDTRLLFSCAQDPKEVWLVPRAGHVDLHHATAKEYESRVLAFLEKM